MVAQNANQAADDIVQRHEAALDLLSGFSVGALLLCTAIWTIGEIIASILVPSFIAKHVAEEVKGRFMALNDIVRSLAGVVCPIGLGFRIRSTFSGGASSLE